MRPKTFSYTPSDNSLTGFLSNATGATWTLTTTTAGDGLAHQVTIRNDSATDHSGKTAVLTGTDANGVAITETLALPGNAGTSTSVLYYKTLTTVVPSATIGADTMDIGWNDVCVGPIFPLNRVQSPFSVALSVDISGTINYTVQYTHNEIFDASVTPTWWSHSTIASKTADTDGNVAYPVRAVRLLINSLTSGATAAFTINQGR